MGNALPWVAIAGAVGLGAIVAVAGSAGSAELGGLPLYALCIATAFLMQWVVFVFAWLAKTERYYDLTGSITFLSLVVLALAFSNAPDLRALTIALLVAIWAVRLGTFLSLRIRKDRVDRRFDNLKTNFARFLMTWTLQGLWVCLSLAAGLVAITGSSRIAADGFLVVGAALWVIGFVFESTADAQKRRFRANADNADRFIDTGLWAWCQHPNYFGEILLWTGIAVAAWPALTGWAYITLISPLFVWVLLTRISGIPLLDAAAKKRWGENADYQSYRARTPKIIPIPPGLPVYSGGRTAEPPK